MVQASCYSLAELVRARYTGDAAGDAAILNKMATGPVELVADILYTCLCLANDHYPEEELAWLRTLDLTGAAWHAKPNYAGGPYRTQPIVYGASLRKEGRAKVPLQLRLREGGATTVRTFERGLGVGGHHKWAFTFRLPPGVFESLDIYLGMHATLGNVPSGSQPHGKMQLLLLLDERVLYDSGLITPETLGSHAVVDVRPGGLLQLRMVDRSGDWANYGNQVVYGEPRLIRSPSAPRGLSPAE
jgi:hypothetical protein